MGYCAVRDSCLPCQEEYDDLVFCAGIDIQYAPNDILVLNTCRVDACEGGSSAGAGDGGSSTTTGDYTPKNDCGGCLGGGGKGATGGTPDGQKPREPDLPDVPSSSKTNTK